MSREPRQDDSTSGTGQRPYSRGEQSQELAVVVEAVRAAVRQRSLRAVARQIGMSPTGLRGVLDGAEPYGRTRDKLRAWYALEQGLERLPVAAAADIIVMLVRDVPSRKAGVRHVLDAIETVHVAGRVPVPTWLPPVRVRLLG